MVTDILSKLAWKKDKVSGILSGVYGIGAYLFLAPILLYGTALGVINQTTIQLTTELLVLLTISLFLALGKAKQPIQLLSFGLILLGAAMGSRLISLWFPGINAIAAIVILTGIYGGSHLGVVVGGLAPYLTNMIFLQGAWTPFQMYGYGLIGLLAGVPWLADKAKNNMFIMTLLAGVMGIAYSLFMDTWTLLSFGTDFGWPLYQLLIVQAIPFTLKYIGSNVVFITILKKPVRRLVQLIEDRGAF